MENKDYTELNSFLENTSTEYKEIIQRLHAIILSTDNRFQSSIKWKMLTFAINGDFHHWICAINITKKISVWYIILADCWMMKSIC